MTRTLQIEFDISTTTRTNDTFADFRQAFFRLVIVYKKPVDPIINKNMSFVNTI